MDARYGQMMVLTLGSVNLAVFLVCLGMVWWSLKWKTRWAQVVVMVVFGMGTLLFGACTVLLGGSYLLNR